MRWQVAIQIVRPIAHHGIFIVNFQGLPWVGRYQNRTDVGLSFTSAEKKGEKCKGRRRRSEERRERKGGYERERGEGTVSHT